MCFFSQSEHEHNPICIIKPDTVACSAGVYFGRASAEYSIESKMAAKHSNEINHRSPINRLHWQATDTVCVNLSHPMRALVVNNRNFIIIQVSVEVFYINDIM